jgi:hypothetical protein
MTDRELYAEQLLHLSARIVGAVHDEGPEAVSKAIDRALIVEAPAGVYPFQALVTILAAQVNADLPTSVTLRWIQWRGQVAEALRLARHHAGTAA